MYNLLSILTVESGWAVLPFSGASTSCTHPLEIDEASKEIAVMGISTVPYHTILIEVLQPFDGHVAS